MPLPVPTQPEPTNNIPPATTGPGAPSDPPCAFPPLTVVYSRAVSYCQSSWPSVVESACSTPPQPPAKTTPGITVTAPSSPTRPCPRASRCASEGLIGTRQAILPSERRTAATAPPFSG